MNAQVEHPHPIIAGAEFAGAAAAQAAVEAFAIYRAISLEQRAAFLEAGADEIEHDRDAIVTAAVAESRLPEGRVTGELDRTTGPAAPREVAGVRLVAAGADSGQQAPRPQVVEASALGGVTDEVVGAFGFNEWPTGVEVAHAMVHGGPFPATSDSRDTSLGTRAIQRFQRPVCYQNVADEVLPEALRADNPWGLRRRRELEQS